MTKPQAVSLAIGLLVVPLSANAASLVVDTTEPTVNVVASNPHTTFATATPGPLGERDTYTTAFSSAAGASYGARGETFLLPGNGSWDVSAITIRADAVAAGTGYAQDISASGPASMKLWVFQWNPANDSMLGDNWILGTGISDGDPFDGTGISSLPVNGVSYDVIPTFNGEFLHFLTPGLQLAGNSAYGFLVELNSASATGVRLDSVRDNVAPTGESYAGGALLRSDVAGNTFNASGDDLVFYVQATAVPEPSVVAFVGCGLLFAAFLRRRN